MTPLPLSPSRSSLEKLALVTSLLFSLRSVCSFAPILTPVGRGLDRQVAVVGGPLFVSSTTSTSSLETGEDDGSPKKKKANERVVYQKIVRSPAYVPDVLLLGTLIEFLETKFRLPNKLSMTYESIPVQDSSEERATLIFDSPLSPDVTETRLFVEVIGVITSKDDDDDDDETDSTGKVPNMAMVVVKKQPKQKYSTIPHMMQNLFADSEKKILKALDRSIDDFSTGRIKMDLSAALGEEEKEEENFKSAEEAIQAELMPDKDDDSISSKGAESSPKHGARGPAPIQDAEIVKSDDEDDEWIAREFEPEEKMPKYTSVHLGTQMSQSAPVKQKLSIPSKEARAAAIASMNQKAHVKAKPKEPAEDFAVQAAARKAQSGEADFAVMAAKRRALESAATKLKALSKKEGVKGMPKEATPKSTVAAAAKQRTAHRRQQQQQRPSVKKGKAIDFDPKKWKAKDTIPRAFCTVISSPEDRRKNRSVKTPASKVQTSRASKSGPGRSADAVTATSASQTSPESKSGVAGFIDAVIDTPELKRDAMPRTEKANESLKSPVNEVRPVPEVSAEIDTSLENNTDNASVDLKAKSSESDTTEESESGTTTTTIGEIPKEKATDTEKQSSSKQPSGPSREQLEQDVIKAARDALEELASQEGSEMSPEELLRDILKFDDDQAKENVEGRGFVSGAFDKAKELMGERKQHVGVKTFDSPSTELSADQELKKMFEAGQTLADGRITKKMSEKIAHQKDITAEDEAELDRLIGREKSVSGHARELDEELAELEVAILRTPGEELDGPQRNSFFDIMSGPEVYNPNVDPETVNYPGAMPGTKEVKLPKELNEAVMQAKFAVNVLMGMKKEKVTDENGTVRTKHFSGGREITPEQIEDLEKVVSEAVQVGIIDDPIELLQDRAKLKIVLRELKDQPAERFESIASAYKDLLLSDNFVPLVKEHIAEMTERDLEALRNDDESSKKEYELERDILGQLVTYTQLLLKEARALGAELEAQQLEIVRSICEVAMDPSHQTEEETAMALTDAVRDMRPLLDDIFVAYIKYAVAEEEAKLARAGVLDDPEHNQWLFVLKIVQQGVYTEIARTVNRYVEHIFYVLRMETPIERRLLLKEFIDVMPTMDVRPFVQVVDNIVSSLGTSVKGDFDGAIALGEMTNKLLQLHRDVSELLPPERIDIMSKDADDWARRQKEKLMEQRKIGMQRLQAARDLEDRKSEIEAFGTMGDVEEFPQ